ncbi:unnamed protein product [Ectocarpus sp. CCAP 1310/34]|nr:unnamed protein product [Ectocarpus sp. CCAP 1310/34]
MPTASMLAEFRPPSSRKRPRSRTVQHVSKSAVLLLSLLQLTTARRPGGGGYHYPSVTPQGYDSQDSSFDGGDWGDWRNQPIPGPKPHGMPFSPPIHRRFEQPEPMDELRSLAISLEEEDRADLGGYIAVVLQKLANMNELFLGERGRKKSVFHSATMPSVAVAEFVERVANNIVCPNVCLMLTLVYMDRLALPSSELHLYVTPLTAHRLFTASLIIAIKFIAEKPPSVFNDIFYEKIHSVTGLAVAELKHLEHHMLQALAKDAYVSVSELNRYMGNFAHRHNEMVPFIDRPYSGPPPFPFQ